MISAYDEKKLQENIRKHGVSFDDISIFEWETAVNKADTRHNYGETRFISYGFVSERLYALVWTLRDNAIRPISFRKANQRERRRYEKDRSAQAPNR